MPQDECAELYCKQCSRLQPVARSGKAYTCDVCAGQVEPPTEPGLCPKAPNGRHNAFRDANFTSGWCCSQCLQPMEAPEDADVIYLGRRTT